MESIVTGKRSGIVCADDFETLQEAIDAVGSVGGGTVEMSSKTYELSRPLEIDAKLALAGTIDAKIRKAATCIKPGPDFAGEALITTRPRLARDNPDLNSDICLRDLVITGREGVANLTAVRATNVDVLRLERCRIAHRLRRAIDVTLETDTPRPYIAEIVPGGLFVNNCIFQASDICINLEYCTQNRIYANWFVSNCGVAVRLKNSNKTWIVANEINTFKRAAILLEDDGKGNELNNIVISLNLCLSSRKDTKYIELVNPADMNNLMIVNNLFDGNASMDMTSIQRGRGHLFHGNGNAERASENSGEIRIPTGWRRIKVTHELMGMPMSIQLTPLQETPNYWIENRTNDSFDIVSASPAAEDIRLLWRAAVQ